MKPGLDKELLLLLAVVMGWGVMALSQTAKSSSSSSSSSASADVIAIDTATNGRLPALACCTDEARACGGSDGGGDTKPNQPRLTLAAPARCRFGPSGQPVLPSTVESREHQYKHSEQQPEEAAAALGLAMKSMEAMEKLLLEQGDCTLNTLSCVGQRDPKALNLAKFQLKSCAVVGNSDSMLKEEHGAEINAHDTVFRYNTPIGHFQPHVGEEAWGPFIKSKYMKKGGGAATVADGSLKTITTETVVFPNDKSVGTTKKLSGSDMRVFKEGPDVDALKSMLKKLYRAYKLDPSFRNKKKVPFEVGARGFADSKGFKRVLALTYSGLCKRVDLYGSRSGGGRYFDKKAQSMSHHLMPLEHFCYRILMAHDRLCIYGD